VARRKKLPKKPEDEYTHLAIRVESYEAQADASINYNVYRPYHSLDLDERDPVYRFITYLTITGTSIYPETRAGDVYELKIYGDDAPSRYLNVTLDDAHVRDEHGVRQYRTYRGGSVPVYKAPRGFGLLQKDRGEKRWRAWVNALPRFVGDMLALLRADRELYIALQERRQGRDRWINSVSLQTTNPAEE